MLTSPPDSVIALVAERIHQDYDIRAEDLEFVPLGEDSWNFRISDRWWVSLRRDLRGHSASTYETARALADRGLDFVVPPIRTVAGRCVSSRSGELPIVVFAFTAARPVLFADPPDTARRVAGLLERLHSCSAGDDLPTEDFALPLSDSLRRAVDRSRSSAHRDAGPLDSLASEALERKAATIEELLSSTIRMGHAIRATRPRAVVTHGDVSPRNVLERGAQLFLIDWGGARLAPPERDWFHLRMAFGQAPDGDPVIEEFYRNRWILSELEEYSSVLTAPHEGTADDHAMWDRMRYWLDAAGETVDGDLPVGRGIRGTGASWV